MTPRRSVHALRQAGLALLIAVPLSAAAQQPRKAPDEPARGAASLRHPFATARDARRRGPIAQGSHCPSRPTRLAPAALDPRRPIGLRRTPVEPALPAPGAR